MDPLPISQRARAAAPYLEALNPEQRAAVEALDGPVLVLAGAGTGKTRVLTTRLAHLITTGKAKPWGVLAVTFTNKAARGNARARRTSDGTGRAGHPLARHLPFDQRANAARACRTRGPQIELHDFGYGRSGPSAEADHRGREHRRETLAGAQSGRADRRLEEPRALAPADVPKNERFHFAEGKGADLYRFYQERLKILNACDFGDLLMHMIAIFRTHPDVLADYHRKLGYLMVDEYQDTNVAQYLWLRLLAQDSKNLCVVGDDDQSIYGWRGAEVDNILRFEHDFPEAKVVRLERNYRSTGHILAAASHLIAQNKGRLGKTLFTDDELGNRVKVRGVWDGEAEARLVADDIEQWVSSPVYGGGGGARSAPSEGGTAPSPQSRLRRDSSPASGGAKASELFRLRRAGACGLADAGV